MNINQLKIGSLLSYFQMALSIVIGIGYTPIMLRLLGQSEYGLYNTVSSAISMLSVLSLGFNSSYIRYYAKYKVKNDDESIYRLNGLFLIIFMIIGFIALLCGTFLSFNLDIVFDRGLTVSEQELAKKLMLLLTVNLTISFPMSVFQNIISAHERYVFLKLLGMMKTVLSPLVTLPLLLMGYRSVAMVSVTLAIALITDISYLIYTKRVLKIKFRFGSIEKGLFKSLFRFTSFIALNLIVDQVNSNMGKFLLARFCGTRVVAVYAVGYSLYQYYMMFSTAISGVFAPRIHRIVNETKNNNELQKKELTSLFTKVGRIQFLVLSLIATGLIFFGPEFIMIWAGKEYTESYYVAVILIISSSIALIQNVGIEIQRAQNNHSFRSIAYIIMAGINLILTIIFSKKFGAVGASLGTATALIVANGFIMNVYYHKKCNIDIMAFWKNILRVSPGLIIPVICGCVMTKYFDFSYLPKMIAGIFVYVIIFTVSMCFIGMNEYERSLVKTPIRRMLKR